MESIITGFDESRRKHKNNQTFMSTQLSPVKATFLFPHTVAVGVDLVFRPASAAYFVEGCEHGESKKKIDTALYLKLTVEKDSRSDAGFFSGRL